MYFITTATAIDDINGKDENGTEKQQKLFNQSYKIKIMPLVIYGAHTHTYTRIHIRMKLISRNQACLV